MGRQLLLDLHDAPLPAVVPLPSLDERFVSIENEDDRRLARQAAFTRDAICKLLDKVISGCAVSKLQAAKALVLRNRAPDMDALALGKAVLRLQIRHRQTLLPMTHIITNGDLRKAGKHLPYAFPQGEEKVA